MKAAVKSLLVAAALTLTYPAMAADPQPPVRPMGAEITKEQFLKQAEARFDARDANKDGKLSVDERRAKRPGPASAARGMMPAEISKADYMKRAEARFDAMDSNKDGKLTRDERRAAHQQGQQRRACRGAVGQGPGCVVPGSAPASK